MGGHMSSLELTYENVPPEIMDLLFGLPSGFTAWQQGQLDRIVVVLGEDVRGVAGTAIVSAAPRGLSPRFGDSIDRWWIGDRVRDLLAVSCLQYVPVEIATALAATIFHIDLDNVRVHHRVPGHRRRPMMPDLHKIGPFLDGLRPQFPSVGGRFDGGVLSGLDFTPSVVPGLPDMSEVLRGTLSKLAAQLPAGIPLDPAMLEFDDDDPLSNQITVRVSGAKIADAMRSRIESQREWLKELGYGDDAVG